MPGHEAQSIVRPTKESEVPGSIPGPARNFQSFLPPLIQEGHCQLLAKLCARYAV